MTDGFKFILLWLCAALVALVVGLAPVSSAFVDGHFIPVGPDGFYHARRILDTVAEMLNWSNEFVKNAKPRTPTTSQQQQQQQ